MSIAVAPSEVEVLRQHAEENFWFFANATMDPGFFSETVHTKLCNFLQSASRRKLAVMPRSFLKTTIVNRYALWRSILNPNYRTLFASNTVKNAEKKVHDVMGIVESSQFFRACWPHLIPDFKTRWSVQGASLKRTRQYPEATFEPAGVGTNIVSRHYNLIIEDDTIAPSHDDMSGDMIMPTREEIEKAIGFHKLTTPLLVSAELDEKIVVGTRWAEDDLIQYILNSQQAGRDAYAVFSIAATHDGTWEGEPTYHRVSRVVLEEIRMELGEYLANALYLNAPSRAERRGFKSEWIHYYKPKDLPDGTPVLCIDPADPPSKDERKQKKQDFTAFNISSFTPHGLYVISAFRARLTDKEIVTRTLDLMDSGAAGRFVVEVNKHAHLEEAFHDEMNRRGKWHACSFIKHKTPKEFRVGKLSPLAESGRLFFPEGGSCKNLEYELVFFGRVLHDDEADALSMQLEENFSFAAPKPEPTAPRIAGAHYLPKYTWTVSEVLEETRRNFLRRNRLSLAQAQRRFS